MKQTIQLKTPSWERKNLAGILGHFFGENCPRLDGSWTIKPVVDEIIIIHMFDEYCPPVERLRMGQMVWYAKDVNETSGYAMENPLINARSMRSFWIWRMPMTMKPFFGAKRNANGRNKSWPGCSIRHNDQGSVLTCSDVAAIMGMASGTISKYTRETEQQQGKLLPRRGGQSMIWDRV